MSKIVGKIVVVVRALLSCIAGSIAGLMFYELAQAFSYYWRDFAPEMGIVYPVILSPVISIPISIFGFIFGYLVVRYLNLNWKSGNWFLFGWVLVLVIPLVDFFRLMR